MEFSRSLDQAGDALSERFLAVRAHSLALTTPLSAEDQCVQSMPDASPAKWHLAHTTWFFEALLLRPHAAGYRPFDARFHYLFNSYYEALGARHPRAQRGLLTRPALEAVHAYRAHVDAAVLQLLASHAAPADRAMQQSILILGLHHEQQHQELILTDILHAFASNPLLPAYRGADAAAAQPAPLPRPSRAPEWIAMPGGTVEIGHAGEGFAFDNETPRHRMLLAPYAIADRLVTCGEYAQFIADGGYARPQLWLSDGWAAVQAQGWRHPAYWLAPDDPRAALADGERAAPGGAATADSGWQVFGLEGLRPLAPEAPVAQLSFYEAAAYAEWAGARLPTEAEWEAAFDVPGMAQMQGHVWQWTRSAYGPYPGFRPLAGAAGEYNGKFMVGQMVLRGSSAATPVGHARASYRNFFPPAARWQFSGLRLAKDL